MPSLGGEGGTVGPDLTGIAKRQKPHEVLESILLPSKIIADQYATYAIETDRRPVVTGRIEREDDAEIVVRPTLRPGPVARDRQGANVAERHRLAKSNMPDGIVNVLQKEQILDLLAFVIAEAERASQAVIAHPAGLSTSVCTVSPGRNGVGLPSAQASCSSR